AHVGLGARGAVVARGAVRLVGEAARPVAIAGARLVALIGRGAAVRGPGAGAAGAHVGLGARGAVVAGGAVRLVGEAARPVAVAGACLVALIGRGSAVRGPAALAAGAHVGLGARGAVVARGAVRLVGEAARPVAVARAGLVALI